MYTDKIIPLEEISAWRENLRAQGKKLVVTNGVFDILHCGHAQYLHEAALLGDVLLVCINNDESVKKLKGESRPINTAIFRARLLASLEAVSAVTIYPGVKALEALEASKPDIYVKGGDYTVDTLDRDEYAVLKRQGADIRFIPFVGNLSTTNIIKRLRGDSNIKMTDQPVAPKKEEFPPPLLPLFSRRSVRKYQGRGVDEKLLMNLIKAAAAAPSACACHPVRFLLATDAALKSELAAALPNGPHITQAPAVILVLGDLKAAHDGLESYMLQDCSAAIENLLLAASMQNLGACWLGIHPRQQRMDSICKIFNLPEHIIPVAAITVGWPGEEKEARTCFQPDMLHINKW